MSGALIKEEMESEIMSADLRHNMIPVGECKNEGECVPLTASEEKRMSAVELKAGDLDGRVQGVEHRLGQIHAKLLDDESGKGQITIITEKIDEMAKSVDAGFKESAERDRLRDKEIFTVTAQAETNKKALDALHRNKRNGNKVFIGIAASLAVALLSAILLNGFKLMAAGMADAVAKSVISEQGD